MYFQTKNLGGGLALWAVFVLASFLLLNYNGVAPARASTPLVSNVGRSDSTPVSFASDYAQSFRTGSQTNGYKLTSVNIDMGVGDASGTEPTYTVAIINSSAGRPGSVVGTLISPDSLVAGLNTFTASGDGIDLTASTNYMVLVDVTNAGTKSVTLKTTRSNDEDPGAATGWKIGDVAWSRSQGGSWDSQTESLKIAVVSSESTSNPLPPSTPSDPPSSPAPPDNTNPSPGGSSPGAPGATQVTPTQLSLSRGPCTAYSTTSHPYDGWPFLHFDRLQTTVSQSSSGRSLATLLTDSHTGTWSHLNNGQEVTLSAADYCNDLIYHRHLVANGGTDCAALAPSHWSNVRFEAVVLGDYGGWCTRHIPRTSWGS